MGNICPCPRRATHQDSSFEGLQQTFQIDDKIDHTVEQYQIEQYKKAWNSNIASDGLNITKRKDHIQIEYANISEPKLINNKQQKPEISTNTDKALNYNRQNNQLSDSQTKQKIPFNTHILKTKTIKKKYNPQDYRFMNQSYAFRVKKIDSIKQQQFNIQNCRDSQFFLFDITANVYIDDCENCVIFIAPCESTIFARNCRKLTMVVATKQFRTYECHDCIFSLYCKSQPVIQSSSNLQFSSFSSPNYSQLPQQFQKMHLQAWNNHWSEIHNFTKVKGQRHYELYRSVNLTIIDWKRAFQEAELMMNSEQNYVPFINGDLDYEVQTQALVLVKNEISDNQIKEAIKNVILLKAFQGVLTGEGMVEKKVLLLDILNFMPALFEPIGTVYISSSDIQLLKAKWLFSFAVSKNQQP